MACRERLRFIGAARAALAALAALAGQLCLLGVVTPIVSDGLIHESLIVVYN